MAKLWLLIALLLLALIVALQNSGAVTVRFLFWQTSLSGFLLVVLPLLAGVVIGFLGAKLGGRGTRAH
jgi:uncharacterized integral membrane protein